MPPAPPDPAAAGAAPRALPAALAAGLLALVALLPRVAPGVTFEDAGELAAAATCLGVPHPPGYPLWMLVAAPIAGLAEATGADPARALALASAVFAAAACAVLAGLARRLGADLSTAVAGGLVPLLAPAFTSQALIVEVYALAACVQAALVSAALGRRARPGAVGLLAGLGVAGHVSTALLAPLIVHGAWRGGVRGLARAAGGAVAGLAVFAYVPLAAARDPRINWGDATGGARLLDHLLRRQYAGGGGPPGPRAAFVFDELVLGWPAVALVGLPLGLLLGPALGGRSRVAVLGLTVVFGALGAVLALPYDVSPLELRVRVAPLVIPVLLASAALVALGLAGLVERLRPRLGRAAVGLAPLAVVAASFAPSRSVHAEATAMAAADGAERYLRETLAACPPDAILLCSRLGFTDVLSFPLVYGQVALGLRPDVTVVDRALLTAPWYREQLAERAPELAPALAALGRTYDSDPTRFADPRLARLASAEFLQAVFDAGRPVAMVERPGPNLLRDRPLVATASLWLIGAERAPEADDPGPAWPWLERQPPSPWIRELEALARERDAARAERRGG